jgi:hypothetical protein
VAADCKGWGKHAEILFCEFPDIGAVQLEAIKSTGEILRDCNYPIEAGSEWRMEVADEARKPLFSLRVIAELHE